MKLLIDISEYNAEYIKNAYGIPQDINMIIAEAIINGKQIPTPHGRLGDLDALQKQVENTIQDAHMSLLWKQGMMYAHGLVETSKTVIEAEDET